MLAVERVGVGRFAFDREDDVVGDHGGVQAEPLAFARQPQDVRARGGGTAGGKIEAVAHGNGT